MNAAHRHAFATGMLIRALRDCARARRRSGDQFMSELGYFYGILVATSGLECIEVADHIRWKARARRVFYARVSRKPPVNAGAVASETGRDVQSGPVLRHPLHHQRPAAS